MMTQELIGMFYPLVILSLGTIITVALLWGITTIVRTRTSTMNEADYKKLMKSQEETAEGVAELRSKVAGIEKMLREVE
jgi:hypothetical protein